MIFKGIRFRHTRTVVTLPFDPADTGPDSNYVRFGKICEPDARGAVRTEWRRDGEPLYAKPIPLSGHSRTNMAYGQDGRVYLCHKGRCYTAPPAKKRKVKAAESVPGLSEPVSFGPPPLRGRRSDLAERAA